MQKKILFILSVLLICLSAISQPVINRTFGTNTVNDPRLMASTNFYIPRYVDTSSANILKGIDTCGAQIFTYSGNAVWYRACNPKRWIKLLKEGDVANVTASNGLNKVSNDIRLGGLLTGSTFIEGEQNFFGITNTTQFQAISQNPSDVDNYAELFIDHSNFLRLRNNLSSTKRTDLIMGKQSLFLAVDYDLSTFVNLFHLDTTFTYHNTKLGIIDDGASSLSDAQITNTLTVFGTGRFTDTLTATTMGVGDSSNRVASTAWVKRQGYGTGSGSAVWGGITGILSDQTDLQAALNLKLNISDTASMLLPYPHTFGYGLVRNGKFVRIDTSDISTRAWRQKGLDSAVGLINLKLNISDTSSMLANYLTGVTNTGAGLNPVFKLNKFVVGKRLQQGDGISLFQNSDSSISIAAPLAQDYSPYRFPPNARFLLNPTLTSDGRNAYTLALVDPWTASNSYMPGTDDTLIITTYDGDANVAHPSMVFIDSGWNGYRYWLAFTPYPAEARENPSILASNDGIIWVVPPGTTNPVVGPPSGSDFYSDVELVFRDDESRMYLFYRFEDGASSTSQHLYKICDDGANWINETMFISNNAGASPTIVFKDSVWHMWDIDYTTNLATQDPFYLIYRTSPSLAGFELAKEYRCVLNNTPAGKHIWHIEIRWNRAEDQFCGIFDYTTINPGGAPNNNGVLAYATSTSTTNWDVRDAIFPIVGSQYRTTFDSSERANQNGARFEVMYNPQWDFRPAYMWLAPRTTAPTFTNYDTIPLQSVYSLKYRRTSHWGFPVAEVRRSSDDSTIHVFPGANNVGLIIRPLTVAKKDGDTTALAVWAGSDSIYLVKLYNQIDTTGDYLTFIDPGQPYLDSSIWNGTSAWGWVNDGVDDFGQSYKTMQFRAIITSASLDTGKLFSRANAPLYFGLNGTNLTALWGANIAFASIPSPQVRTGLYGTSGSLRINGSEVATGSTTFASSVGQYKSGVYFNGTTNQDYHKGRYAEFVTFNTIPSAGALAHIEGIMGTEYAYDQDSVLYDNFTDANGTLLTSHTPTLAPGGSSWAASDANFEIQSNALTRSAAGSDNQTATINSGISNGYFSGTYTPGVSGGSGIVFRHTDNSNFYYVRVFSGTTLGLFKLEAGVETLVQSAAVTAAGTWSVVIECWGSRIRVFLNGATTPQITVTNTFNMTATNIGVRARSADFPQVWENIKATPFINL
jgi:hypothetical protein